MAQPPSYTPTTNFNQEETSSVAGRSTIRTSMLDVELANLQTTLNDVLTNISLNQRDDGEIRDGRVKPHTLATDALALMGGSWTPQGDWVTATAYVISDVVGENGATYVCVTAHTSGTFATDRDTNGYWLLVANPALGTSSAFVERFSGDGATTDFTLSVDVNTDEKAIMVFVAGAMQDPLSAYTVANTMLSFTAAPASGTNNVVVWAVSQTAASAVAAAQAAQTTAETAQTNAETAEVNAETAETNAEAAKTAAETARNGAEAAEANAVASAAAAAANASSGLYKEIIQKSGAYTVLSTENGALVQVDTSGGAVTITLPDSSGLSEDFRVAIAKMTGDANAVTVQRSGSDTINGIASSTVGSQYETWNYLVDSASSTWLASGGTGAGVTGANGVDVSGGVASLDLSYSATWTGTTTMTPGSAVTGLTIDQDYDASSIVIDSESTTATVLNINTATTTGDTLKITGSAITTGNLLDIRNTNASATSAELFYFQSNAGSGVTHFIENTGNATASKITNAGTSNSLLIDHNGSNSGASGVSVDVDGGSSSRGQTITHNGTGAGTYGLVITQTGAAPASAMWVNSTCTDASILDIRGSATTFAPHTYLYNSSANMAVYLLRVVQSNGSAAGDAVKIEQSGTGNGITYQGPSSKWFAVKNDGDCENTNNSYGGWSDIKLKQDIIDASSQLEDIRNLRFRKYRWKSDVAEDPDAPSYLGLIAQEVEEVSPGLVSESKDWEEYEHTFTNEDGEEVTETRHRDAGTTTKTLKYSILNLKVAKALQEALVIIDDLERRIEALENT